MKQNLLFNQATAIGKRLAMVLTMLLTIGIGTMWGAEVTFSSFSTLGSSGYPSGSTTSDPITMSSTGWYGYSNTQLRIKSGATLTISCTENYKITKVVFTVTGTNYAKLVSPVTWNSTTGTYSNVSGTNSITFSNSAQVRITKIVVTYESTASCDKKVTITKGAQTNGTFTLDKENGSYDNCDENFVVKVSNIVPISSSQYCNGINATGGNSSVTGPVDGVWTVTYAKENNITSTITPTYADKTPANISFENMSNPTPTTTGYYVGDTYTLPATNDYTCGDKTFVGWSTEIIENSATKPTAATYFEPGASVTLAADQTFYAVFAEGSGDAVETSIAGGDWSKGATPEWTTHDQGVYSDNGVKFDSTSDYVLSPNIATSGYTELLLKFKAGYNGSQGSVLTIYAYDKELALLSDDQVTISPSTVIPDVKYTEQTKIYQVSISAKKTIGQIMIQMTSRTSNLGMKYCELFAISSQHQNYTTQCSNKTTYSVTWNPNGGNWGGNTNNQVDFYEEDESIIEPAGPTREGYTFNGWDPEPADNMGTKNLTYTAQWTPIIYTITYDNLQEATNPNASIISYTIETETITFQPITENIPEGYQFKAWDPASIEKGSTGNKTITAQWTKLHTITWKVNGEEYTVGTPTISVEDGNAITHLPTAPSAPSGCSEKEFVGWSDSEISEETDTKPTTLFTDAASAPAIDGDKTFHAVFADEEGGGGGTTAQSITNYQDGTYYLIDSFTDADEKTTYHSPKGTGTKIPSEDMTEYVSVNNNVLTLNLTNAPLTEDMKYTISKENDSYSIHNSATTKYVGANASGTDLNTTTSAWNVEILEDKRFMFWYQENDKSARSFLYQDSYNSGGTKTYGRQFGNYAKSVAGTINNQSGKECYGSGYFFLVPATRGTTTGYTTLCDATKATITYDLNGGTGETCAKTTVKKGEEFDLCDQTPTKEGYEFAGWTDGVNTYAAGAPVTVDESTTFYAKWNAKTITITWDQNYTNCPEAATSTYIYDGEEIAMPAEPSRTGYKFTGWFDAATDGTQVTEVGETNKPTADVIYYAHWAELYTVTFRASGQVYVVQEYKYLSGETLELPADPSAANYACDGYIFEGWSADEKTEDATKPGLISNPTITNDETYYAVWKKATTEGVGGNGYYLVEEELTDYSGDYLIVSYDNNYAMSTSGEDKIGTNTYAGFEDISAYYANKVIASNATTDTYVFTAAKTTNGYSLHCQQNDTYLGILNTSTGTGTVLRYYNEGDYNTKLSECEWTIGVGSVSNYAHRNVEDKNGAKGQYIRWNETNTRFAIYKETSVKGIHLYKKGAGASYLYTTSPSCGPTIVAKDGMWVTSANGQSVKVNVPIAVKSFTTTATIIGTSTNENFEITPLENVGNGINDVVEVIYTPTTADTKESATITLTAKDGETVVSTTTFTLNGRSLPDQFAIVVDKASEYFALPANMPSAGTYPGYSVALNAGSVTSAPKTHLYTAQAVHSTRFDENGTALRLVGNNNACLWATNAVSGTGIRNYAQLDNAKTADYEWNLYTEDGDTYRISCSIVTEEGRILRMYGANFGMYKSGAEVFYLLPVECTSTPTNIQVSPARVGATISWENAATCNLQILKEGTPVQQPISGAVSPVVVTGLEELTAYTFTLTPTDAASCKVDGAFTTTGPDIDIVEWMTDGMIIQVDKDDAVNPSVVINGEVEYNTGSGAVATELFFSKYFEAHGENKLLAIYNGTGAPIDLSGYTIKSENGTLDLSQFGQTKGQVAPNEEIILVYYDEVYSAEVCAELQEGYENWNILTEKSVLAFSGRGSIGLYKDDVLIDVIGSTFPSGELTKIGKSGKPDYCGTEDDVRLYIDEESVNDQSSFFCYNGDNIKTDEEENDYAISTNRCLLIRKNTVTSGANAVASNKADAGATCGDLSSTFTTLCSEWSGFRIGGGKSSDEEIRDATCDGLGYVGGFDYSKYYREYQQIGDPTTLDEFVYNEDENLYKITINPLSNYSCLNVSVELRDPNTEELLTQQVAQVPIIVANENTTTDELFSNIIADDLDASKTRCSTCDVVILKNATLTKAAVDTENDVNQVRNIYIYPGGKLVVPADGNDYSVNSLSLRRVEDEVSMASVQTPLLITSSAANPIYVDVRVNSENWHWFTLPYNCNIADVTWADGTPAKYNVDWFLMWYDGESRSNQKSNYESHWKVYEGTTLEAGKGYIVGITGHPTKSKVKYELRFPMAQEVLAAEQTDKPVAVNAWGVKKDIRPNHKGWNLVGNPYMDYYNTASSYSLGGLPLIEYADTYDPITGLWDYEERESGSVPFLVIPQDGGWSEYQQELASEVDMQPFTAYFVQVGDPNNEGHSNGMKLDASFETTKRGRSSLIRRAPSEVDEQEEPAIVAVELTNAKGESDKTTLLIADRFTNEYEMNADFFKWFGDYYTYYTKPVLYTLGADNESRAFNALNEELAAQPVALGMYAAQAGEYTFSLHQRSNLTGVAEVWLHDASNNTHTNLLQDDYTFSTSKTNGAGRFSLSVKMMPKLPTDVENIKQGNVWATTQDNEIVINGLTKDMQLWIYDATGKLLHADRTTNYQHSYSVPQTGAYFVRVHDKNDAQTIKVVVE